MFRSSTSKMMLFTFTVNDAGPFLIIHVIQHIFKYKIAWASHKNVSTILPSHVIKNERMALSRFRTKRILTLTDLTDWSVFILSYKRRASPLHETARAPLNVTHIPQYHRCYTVSKNNLNTRTQINENSCPLSLSCEMFCWSGWFIQSACLQHFICCIFPLLFKLKWNSLLVKRRTTKYRHLQVMLVFCHPYSLRHSSPSTGPIHQLPLDDHFRFQKHFQLIFPLKMVSLFSVFKKGVWQNDWLRI